MPLVASRWRQPDGKEVGGLQEQRAASNWQVDGVEFANNLSEHGPHFPPKSSDRNVALTDTSLGLVEPQEVDTAKPTWLSDIQKWWNSNWSYIIAC